MELLNNKPLLELLSPFADKTLSEGLIYSDIYNGIEIIDKGVNIDSLVSNILNGSSKNFGHIGITTVLKYLEKNSGVKNFVKHWKIYDDYILYEEWIGEDCTITKIPNKELRLYTKQELITLYNLLKELG